MRRRTISWLTSSALVLAHVSLYSLPSAARIHGGISTGGGGGGGSGCVYAVDNGCAGANPNGSFKNASLLTSAQQSGQNSLLPHHPMTFNIPGVDYAIGPDKTLAMKDPRTINDGVCAYVPANSDVECFTGGPVVHEVLDGYDFSGAIIGKSPLTLYIATSDGVAVGSTIVVTNSYFYVPAGDNKSIGYQGEFSITFKNNQCDGSIATLSSQFCFGDDGSSSGTTLDAEYNVFSNQQVGRVLGGAHLMSNTWKYNLIQGLNDQLSANHGEVEIRNCSAGGCVIPISHYEGNFIIWNSTTTGSVNNATFFPSTGNSNGLKFNALNIINNISVNNLDSFGGGQVGNGLFDLRASNYGVVAITGNWLDSAGQGGCGINGVSSGGSNVTASTSGNTITLTNTSTSFGSNPIEPGWQIFHAGFATANITAFGTASGNLGTYTFDGAPQTVGSDSNWTIVPGFTSATLTGNFLLNDPSHTGTPTAIGFNGPQMGPTNCF